MPPRDRTGPALLLRAHKSSATNHADTYEVTGEVSSVDTMNSALSAVRSISEISQGQVDSSARGGEEVAPDPQSSLGTDLSEAERVERRRGKMPVGPNDPDPLGEGEVGGAAYGDMSSFTREFRLLIYIHSLQADSITARWQMVNDRLSSSSTR